MGKIAIESLYFMNFYFIKRIFLTYRFIKNLRFLNSWIVINYKSMKKTKNDFIQMGGTAWIPCGHTQIV